MSPRATLSTSERRALAEFMQAVRTVLGSELQEARLFGSRARGEGHEHSDLDVVLVVRAGGRRHRHGIYDLAFDVGLRHGVQLAPLVLEEQQLQELRDRERLIASEIDAQGIPL